MGKSTVRYRIDYLYSVLMRQMLKTNGENWCRCLSHAQNVEIKQAMNSQPHSYESTSYRAELLTGRLDTGLLMFVISRK